ncbi:dynamin family protein [Bacillus sp. Marseille-Q3570]|uniref:dynamin family protein n=1 Tax=Bacillus sp. Marseille-Q3570 TaxID=2963522 RepID=UPI0021B8484A|nr:dynamin family protein [Bacillus sp. Marseille-Q3570]
MNIQNGKTHWVDRFYRLNTYLEQNEAEPSLLHKVKELTYKSSQNELTIAFCGHFSAGKSSMINRLMGEDLLPSSPIPTSANIVAIKDGEPRVLLTDLEGKKVSYPGELDIDQVKKASKNGEEVKTIEIFKHHPFLEDETVVMDTPGIDSVDDAHRVSTESMLHLADVIVYVMDYNHVQSELNFNFTKEMQELGKEVYLVINQIDKHSEEELSFDDYREQTIDAFKQWGVQASGIYFTTLKKEDHANNQLAELQDELKEIKINKQKFIHQTLDHMSAKLTVDYLEKKYPDLSDQDSALEGLQEEMSALTERKEQLEKQEGHVEKEFADQLKKLIDNARIAPYEVRELGREVLEAMKEDFKTGFLFARRKTEEERASRIEQYVEAVNEKVTAELEWHIKEELQKQIDQLNVNDPVLENEIHEMEHRFTADDVERLQQKGATFNETYVLQYNRDVEDDLKKQYRRTAIQIFKAIKSAYANKHIKPEMKEIEAKRADLTEQHAQAEKAYEHKQSFKQEHKELNEMLHTDEHMPEAAQWSEQVKQSFNVQGDIGTWTKVEEQEAQSKEPTENRFEENTVQYSKSQVQESASQLDKTVELLSRWNSLRDLKSRMKDRSEKIKNQQYTVALFGAFSAGKSSFANAWLKDHVLPVSPNPTTATINKILPVTEEYPHGTVKIEMKSPEVLVEELKHSLHRFDESCESIDEALEAINRISTEKPDPHYNFLKAVEKGYSVMKEYLGTDQIIAHENFSSFVAQEEKACFTESVELYYDCELTRQGITLVDTPGADSINARHTSVAFDYIKNADAIIFVTYYNHAFSKADRDFLIQLGRVKDTFSMDKMYFVINAADLAKDEEEREAVVGYVTEQLIEYGIRFPRMYALSSKLALLERKEGGEGEHSNFACFENEFETATIRERNEVSVNQANELMKSGLNRLTKWIEHAQSDEEHQEREKVRLESEKTEIIDHINAYALSPYKKSVVQETNELLHYVVQRMMLTFNDEYKVAFNPSVLTKDMKPNQLEKCLDELLESMLFQLSQELRATTLRIEKHFNHQRDRFHEMIENHVAERSSCQLLKSEELTIDTPSIEPEWPRETFAELKTSLKKFKNPKQFFEGNGREVLRQELSEKIQPQLQAVVETFTSQFSTFYSEGLEKEINHLKQQFIEEVDQYYAGILEAFASKEQLGGLIETRRELTSIMNNGIEAKHEG